MPRANRRVTAALAIATGLALTLPTTLVARQPGAEAEAPGAPAAVAGSHRVTTAVAPAAPDRAPRAHPKLDTALAAIADAAGRGEGIQSAADGFGLRYERGRVQVVVTTDGRTSLVESAIRAAGGYVTSHADSYLQAWVSPDALRRLAGLDAVHGITQPQAPTLMAGASMTEGLAAMGGGAWHTAGYNGAGIRIAVIDGGFIGAAQRQATGDLPGTAVGKNFVDGEPHSDFDTDSAHGTGVAEIVHDIAPGAKLFLIKVGTHLDLAQAVNFAINRDVHIITTSLGWFTLTPGDGTGFFDKQVDKARAAGILWTTAAANSRETYWDGKFTELGSTETHNFGTGNVNYFTVDGGATCAVFNSGFAFRLFMSWNDWAVVNQDYDLHVFRLPPPYTTWTYVAGSTNDQAGSFPTPTEFIEIVTQQDNCYGYAIERISGTGRADLRVYDPNWLPTAWFDYARSLSNLADAPAAFTTAALDAQTKPSYPQEPYSSQGPAMGPGGSIAGGAVTMDISAYANVDTQAYGANTFNGTSAATPHVAGAAALVMDARPGFTLEQVENFLRSRAQDKGAAGIDPIFGAGRLRLGAPPP